MNMITRIEGDAPALSEQKSRPERNGARPLLWGALALLAAGGMTWKYAGQPEAQASAAPMATVGIATPLSRAMTQWDDYVGRFAPSQTVDIRPRISGAVTAVHFHDGDFVRQGQLLFTIDQRPFRAALAEANANTASARSALLLAQNDYARVQRLNGDEAVSASEVDALRSRFQAAQATLAAAQARERQRALDGGACIMIRCSTDW
jgi:multidrug efflux system membrane fusion protein